MADYDENIDGLDEMIANLESIPLSRKEKSIVVEAGAQVVQHDLTKATKDKMNPELNKIVMDFKKSHGGRYEYEGHLYQGLTHKPNEFMDGSTNVGFQKGYVTVAHWLDGGTYRQPATYFFTKALLDAERSKEVTKAQEIAMQEIMNKKGF